MSECYSLISGLRLFTDDGPDARVSLDARQSGLLDGQRIRWREWGHAPSKRWRHRIRERRRSTSRPRFGSRWWQRLIIVPHLLFHRYLCEDRTFNDHELVKKYFPVVEILNLGWRVGQKKKMFLNNETLLCQFETVMQLKQSLRGSLWPFCCSVPWCIIRKVSNLSLYHSDFAADCISSEQALSSIHTRAEYAA